MTKRIAMREPGPTGELFRAEAPGMQERERRQAAGPMDGDAAFQAFAPARTLAQDTGAGIADGDWDDLFNAVKDRLIRIVSESGSGLAAPSEPGAAQIRDQVLDCVAALCLLQDSVTAERVRDVGLESAVFEAQSSLAQVRAALVGTQEGERRARHDASHDSLTRLPNRAFLRERIIQQLAMEARRQRMFAVMFLDLNGFKRVNDNHGHAVGDKLLRIIAERLRRVVRAQDVVSRVGGDEFACMIGGVDDPLQLAHLADKMVQAISAPCTVGRLQLVVHASVGIATWPLDGREADALLKSADLAMYAAKRQGARHAFFSRDGAAATAARQGPQSRSPPLPRS